MVSNAARARRRHDWWCSFVLTAMMVAPAPPAVSAQECENGHFESTFELIQTAVFDRHGCTNALCHGAAQMGGLDLSSGAAYDNLVDVAAQTPPIPGWQRILAGQSDASLLWINLAAKTFPDRYEAPLRPMPLDPEPALSSDEIEALRRWIEGGAPRTGVVPGTAELLDACLPPPEPIEVKPLPPPPAGKGLQIRMPRWVLDAQSEREVCFATYYDVTNQVPAEFRGPTGTTFRYKFHQTRQDPLSHHMVPVAYEGMTPPDSPLWGGYRCRSGARDGEVCDPFAIGSCGPDGECTTPLQTSVACIGYGPGDGGIGLSTAGISITQQTAEEFYYAPGVYNELPLKGMILWSSHAFNLTDKAGKLEAWLNFEFAPPEEQQTPALEVFAAEAVFKMNVPAFGTDEPCHIFTAPLNAHVFELSSHMHKRGKRWRTFLGAFRCQGGPTDGAPCSPMGYDFASPDVCGGAPCVSMARPHVGDCNHDQTVTVDELVRAMTVALETEALSVCAEADTNADHAVTVEEIVIAVRAALNGVPPPAPRDPEASLLYVSLTYNDPLVLRMREPLVFSSPVADERALTYCALYDNGYTDPSEVKMRATSPPPPFTLPIGGPCVTPTHCTRGKLGQRCTAGTERVRNESCDTSPGMGDGLCDACTLLGGVTTEDEMFILLGQYFVR
jgi:hypothetical protein